MTPIEFKLRMRSVIEQCLGLYVIRTSHHGHRFCTDLKKCSGQISVVFDIGANIGQSALQFRAAFPKARIYCFEPVRSTFEVLKKNMRGDARLSCHQIAFGSTNGQAEIYLTGYSFTNTLKRPNKFVGSEIVELCKVDKFARDKKIKQIHLLKIDAEGFDLEVLKGAKAMLSSGQIRFVLVEIGFQPEDGNHVLLRDVSSYLLPMGYVLFGIYDQQPEWKKGKRLQYANACFSNQNAIICR